MNYRSDFCAHDDPPVRFVYLKYSTFMPSAAAVADFLALMHY